MRSAVSFAILAGVMAMAAGCTTSAPTSPSVVHPDVLAKAGLQYYWQMKVSLQPCESVSRMYKMDENVYLLTNLNRLICVDAQRGVSKWAQPIAPADQRLYRPCHAEKASLTASPASLEQMLKPAEIPAADLMNFRPVLINTVERLVVLDRDNGRIVRDVKLGFSANTGGASDGESFFVGTSSGQYYCVRLLDCVTLWNMYSGGMMIAPPAYYSGVVYVGGSDGILRATLAAKRPREEWVKYLGGPVTAKMTVDDRGCFVSCEDNRLYVFDAITGAKRSGWDQPFICQGPLKEPAQVGTTSVFQYAKGDRFYAINLVNAKKRWDMRDGRAVLGIIDGNVCVLDSHNNLRMVEEVVGTPRFSLPLSGYDLYAGNTGDSIYVANRNGRLACIRGVSAGPLTSEVMSGGATSQPTTQESSK